MAKYFESLNDPNLIAMIKNGSIGVLPTDTVYGLVGSASLEQAIGRMYAVKSRKRQPGTTIASSLEQLVRLGFPDIKLQKAKKYWPGAISVEMPASNIPLYLSTGQPTMAVRLPNYKELTFLLKQTGPLMTTSANSPSMPTATTLQMAQQYFGDEIDFYVDGGDLSGRPPSTIIGFDNNDSVIVYRVGAVKI